MGPRELERAAGAVLLPEVRVADHGAPRPDAAYLERYPPAGVVVSGRAGDDSCDPRPRLAAVRADLQALGEPACFAACEPEQGVGLPFAGCTRLPPALALAAAAAGARADEERGLDWIRTAGEITAHEAREQGIELVLAPEVDVDMAQLDRGRGFGDDPDQVTGRARAFHEGLRAGGASGCAVHLHGCDDAAGSQQSPVHARHPSEPLESVDRKPLRALVQDGVTCILAGQLGGTAPLQGAGLRASIALEAIAGTLRGRLGFEGVVLAAAGAPGALGGQSQPHAQALAAGCDGLLRPRDPAAAAAELLAAVQQGRLRAERLLQAADRMRSLRDVLRGPGAGTSVGGLSPADRTRFAGQVAGAALCLSTRRWGWRRGRPCEVLAPLQPTRGLEARALVETLRNALAGSSRPAGVVLPVLGMPPAGGGPEAGRVAALARIEAKAASLRSLGWPVGLVWLDSPRSLPRAWWGREELPVLVAHAPIPPLVEAVRRWLSGGLEAGGSLPCNLG